MSYNPNWVPSIRVNAERRPDPAGEREPLCRACVGRINENRRRQELEPIAIHPEAYEPCSESEVEL